MPELAVAAVNAVLAYALGCFSTGYYLVRWRAGLDLRTVGSGATGGRNVGRILGRPWFLATGAGDLAKSALAIAIPSMLGLGPLAVGAAMAGVTAGHIWPAQLGFRGGKGIAPYVGTTAMAVPLGLAGAVLAGAILVALTRRRHVGGLAGLALTPALGLALHAPLGIVLGSTASVALVLVAHLANLRAEVGAPPSFRLAVPLWPGRGGDA